MARTEKVLDFSRGIAILGQGAFVWRIMNGETIENRPNLNRLREIWSRGAITLGAIVTSPSVTVVQVVPAANSIGCDEANVVGLRVATALTRAAA